MTPQPSQIAHYRLTAKLGEGGMGAVYRALDTKLNREVAIKILPDALANDPDYLARFTREAQVLAALNHPNIAAVYGVEDRAIVMELVEGRELPTPLPLHEALPIARQIAEALEAAHEKGIVHRDLKPANIKLTPDGNVKVLDFGLAKAAESSTSTVANSPTLTLRATQAGVIMGTAAYMAPEQAAGKPVDKRADIWAFGVVLYELITGDQLFQGETVSHILAHVLTREVDLSGIDPALQSLLRRCLQRDPRQRLRDIGDARLAIDEYLAAPPAPPAAIFPVTPTRRAIVPWALATVLAITAGYFAFTRPKPAAPAPVRFQIPIFDHVVRPIFDLSPDGRYLAYSAQVEAKNGLYIRPLDSNQPRFLTGTEGATYPIWSPDSAALAFFADGKLKRVPVAGGIAQTISDAPEGRGGAWLADNTIVFAPSSDSPLYRVPAAGGKPLPLSTPKKDEYDRYPTTIAGSGKILFLRTSKNPEITGVYLVSVGSYAPVRILPDETQAYFVADPAAAPGWLLFGHEGALVAQRFDPATARLSGEPVLLAPTLAMGGNTSRRAFSASTGGALAFRLRATNALQLAWVDRSGKSLDAVTAPSEIYGWSLSPDEKRIVLNQFDGRRRDLWIMDLEHGTRTRFTQSGVVDSVPIWSPDGRYIAWAERPAAIHSRVLRKLADGSAAEELIAEFEHQTWIYDWSADDKFLLVGNTVIGSQFGNAFTSALIPMPPAPAGSVKYEALRQLTGSRAVVSPDSRRIVAIKQAQASVARFPEGGPAWQPYSPAVTHAAWSSDGRELYLATADRKLVALSVESSPAAFKTGPPRTLFEFSATFIEGRLFQPSRDGKRFLMQVIRGGGDAIPPLDVVLNWPATLGPELMR